MSNRLTCFEPYNPQSGLEDSNSVGPSSLNTSDWVEYLSENGTIVSISDQITIDSLFYSKRLNKAGGNAITRGNLYEARLLGIVDEDDVFGRRIHGGTRMVLTNLYTLDTYSMVVIAVQRKNSDTYVVMIDEEFSEDLASYIQSIEEGNQNYRLSHDCITESADGFVFPFEGYSTKFKVNLIRNDRSKYIFTKLLGTSTIQGTNPNLWIRASKNALSTPQFSDGSSLLLRDSIDGSPLTELKINGDCSYRNQSYDQIQSIPINLGTLKVSSALNVVLTTTKGLYKEGEIVYISQSPLDLEADSYGINYVKAIIVSVSGNALFLKVTHVPQGATASGNNWYVTVYDPQINIPIEHCDFLDTLSDITLPFYYIETCSASFRVQIESDPKFSYYMFRYKPKFSWFWKEVKCLQGSNSVSLALPNSYYECQLVGYGINSGEFSNYSDSLFFNTFS